MCGDNIIDDRVAQLERRIALMKASEAITVRRLALLEEHLDRLQDKNEEELFERFTERYYSEAMFAVRCQYEAEIAMFDRYRRVLLKLGCYLPKSERREAERLLTTRAPATRRNGNLTVSEVRL